MSLSLAGAAQPELPPRPDDCPLRLGTREQFERVRAFIAHIGYSEAAICETLELPSVVNLQHADWDSRPLHKLSAALRLFLQMFGRTQSVAESEIVEAWGANVLADFLALGLMQPSRSLPDRLFPTVWLSPVGDFVAASDMLVAADSGARSLTGADAVFPANHSGSWSLVKFVPPVGGGEALDLCGGCGIGALHLARTARVATSSDITPRAAFFAAFNAQLNATPIETLCGDLYAPVEGRRFDMIIAHPPYIPTIDESVFFRDGGEAGDSITRGIVQGLAEHLRPGGTAIVVCAGRDTNAQPYELRVRDWLGAAAAEFDVILGVARTDSIDWMVEIQRTSVTGDVEGKLQRLRGRLIDLDTKQFVYGPLVIRRQAVASPPLRLAMIPQATAASFDHLFVWRLRRRQPDFQDFLKSARPRLAPHFESHTQDLVGDPRFAMAAFAIKATLDFEVELEIEGGTLPTIWKLDGQRTVMEAFDASRDAGELPRGYPIEGFTNLVDLMIERGFLELDRAA